MSEGLKNLTERFLYYLERVDMFWWILLVIFIYSFAKNNRKKYLLEELDFVEATARTLFPAYVLMIFVFTVLIRLPNNEYTAYLIPLWSYQRLFETHDSLLFFEIIGNILLFIPYGILLPLCQYLKRKNIRFTLITGVCLSLFLELFQFVTRVGTFETDDIINNFIGIVMGCAVFTSTRKFFGLIKKGG